MSFVQYVFYNLFLRHRVFCQKPRLVCFFFAVISRPVFGEMVNYGSEGKSFRLNAASRVRPVFGGAFYWKNYDILFQLQYFLGWVLQWHFYVSGPSVQCVDCQKPVDPLHPDAISDSGSSRHAHHLQPRLQHWQFQGTHARFSHRYFFR